MAATEMARFDTRLPREQKELFEQAAMLGGFRNLTDFVLKAAQEFANKIIDEKVRILASEEDQAIFFNALMNPPSPNDKLSEAARQYREALQ